MEYCRENRNMGNVLSYALSVAHLNYILMILLKSLYLESQKTPVRLFMHTKKLKEVFNKEKIKKSCWVKESQTDA